MSIKGWKGGDVLNLFQCKGGDSLKAWLDTIYGFVQISTGLASTTLTVMLIVVNYPKFEAKFKQILKPGRKRPGHQKKKKE